MLGERATIKKEKLSRDERFETSVPGSFFLSPVLDETPVLRYFPSRKCLSGKGVVGLEVGRLRSVRWLFLFALGLSRFVPVCACVCLPKPYADAVPLDKS